jgi:hypothetical protein
MLVIHCLIIDEKQGLNFGIENQWLRTKTFQVLKNLKSLNASFSIGFEFQLLNRIIGKICKELQNGQLGKLIPNNQKISNSIKYADIGVPF